VLFGTLERGQREESTVDDLTYAEVGATRAGPLPPGYRHLRYRTRLGRDDLADAGTAVLTFAMQRAAGVRIRSSAPMAALGVSVTSGLGIGPLRLWAPCRVVWVEQSEDRAGFAYGTLPGHPERGEESFLVSRDGAGDVWLAVTAFSLPASWYTRAAGPVVPVFQAGYARLCGRALRRVLARR
jgi:uncharacterized protein (UPF0548 family)